MYRYRAMRALSSLAGRLLQGGLIQVHNLPPDGLCCCFKAPSVIRYGRHFARYFGEKERNTSNNSGDSLYGAEVLYENSGNEPMQPELRTDERLLESDEARWSSTGREWEEKGDLQNNRSRTQFSEAL